MKTDQVSRAEVIDTFIACCNKEVSHCHLHFGRNSKAGMVIGTLYSRTKEKLRVFPDWRLLASAVS